MELFKRQTHIDFLRWDNAAIIFSVVLTLLAVGSLVVRGLNFAVDFTGGLVMEVSYPESVELDGMRTQLANAGYEATLQHFGTTKTVLMRLAPEAGKESAQVSEELLKVLRQSEPNVAVNRVEYVGPQVGKELAENGGKALIIAIFGLLLYVSIRFQYRLAVGAILALIHDSIIVIGIFSLFQIPFDLTVLAAVLAVIGYSLNDTIVVFDRVRENFRKMRKGSTAEITNAALNQTLSRTINTGLTTVLVLVALLVWGGEMISGFALALLIGVVFGTYSSVYVATVSAIKLGLSREDLLPVVKEGAEVDELP